MEMPADIFLMPYKAAELAESLTIPSLAEMSLSCAGEKR